MVPAGVDDRAFAVYGAGRQAERRIELIRGIAGAVEVAVQKQDVAAAGRFECLQRRLDAAVRIRKLEQAEGIAGQRGKPVGFPDGFNTDRTVGKHFLIRGEHDRVCAGFRERRAGDRNFVDAPILEQAAFLIGEAFAGDFNPADALARREENDLVVMPDGKDRGVKAQVAGRFRRGVSFLHTAPLMFVFYMIPALDGGVKTFWKKEPLHVKSV